MAKARTHFDISHRKAQVLACTLVNAGTYLRELWTEQPNGMLGAAQKIARSRQIVRAVMIQLDYASELIVDEGGAGRTSLKIAPKAAKELLDDAYAAARVSLEKLTSAAGAVGDEKLMYQEIGEGLEKYSHADAGMSTLFLTLPEGARPTGNETGKP